MCIFFFACFVCLVCLSTAKEPTLNMYRPNCLTDDLTRTDFHIFSFFTCGRANEWNDNFSNWRFEHLKNFICTTCTQSFSHSLLLIDKENCLRCCLWWQRQRAASFLILFGAIWWRHRFQITPFSFQYILSPRFSLNHLIIFGHWFSPRSALAKIYYHWRKRKI